MPKKETAKDLKKTLLSKSNQSTYFPKKDLDAIYDYNEGYKTFLGIAKTERKAVSEAVRLAKENGFKVFDPSKKYKAGDKVYLVNRDKALVLAVIGTKAITDGVSFAVAHVDSPRLDLKPNPLYEKDGFAYFDTHYYGGIKKYKWTKNKKSFRGGRSSSGRPTGCCRTRRAAGFPKSTRPRSSAKAAR